MTESAWTAEELDRIGVAEELANAPRRADGTLLRARPIWVVRVDDQLYVRSWRGPDGSWFQTGQRSGEGHISGVAPRDAGVAGALVNVAHHLGGAVGLGILIAVFDAAGAEQHGRLVLADRVSASFTAACVLLVLALVVTVLARPHRRAEGVVRAEDTAAVAVAASLAHPGADALSDSRA